MTEVLNKARTMAAHPGAYVRGMRTAPADLDLRAVEGYGACYDIVMHVSQELSIRLRSHMARSWARLWGWHY